MSAAPAPAIDVPPTDALEVTIYTNSVPAPPQITQITVECLDANGDVISDASGLGPNSLDVLGTVTATCPVNFMWVEQSDTPGTSVTCPEFKLFFTGGSPAPLDLGGQTDFPLNPPLLNAGLLLRSTIVASGTWEFSGHVFVSVNGADPVALTFDPELEIEAVG